MLCIVCVTIFVYHFSFLNMFWAKIETVFFSSFVNTRLYSYRACGHEMLRRFMLHLSDDAAIKPVIASEARQSTPISTDGTCGNGLPRRPKWPSRSDESVCSAVPQNLVIASEAWQSRPICSDEDCLNGMLRAIKGFSQ